MKVSAQYAEEHIADLLVAASNGEEVEIAMPQRRALKLGLAESSATSARPAGRRVLEAGRGEMRSAGGEDWQRMDPVWKVPERPRAELFGSLTDKMEVSADWDSEETNLEIEREFEGAGEFQDELPG